MPAARARPRQGPGRARRDDVGDELLVALPVEALVVEWLEPAQGIGEPSDQMGAGALRFGKVRGTSPDPCMKKCVLEDEDHCHAVLFIGPQN